MSVASAQALHSALPEADLWFWNVGDTVHEVAPDALLGSFPSVRRAVRAEKSRHRRDRSGARPGSRGRPPAGARPARRRGGEWRTAGDVRDARHSVHRLRLRLIASRLRQGGRQALCRDRGREGAGRRGAGRCREGAGRIRQADRQAGAGRIELRPDLRQLDAGHRRRAPRGEDRRISARTVRLRRGSDLRRAGAIGRLADRAADGGDHPGRGRLRLRLSRKISRQIDPGNLPGAFCTRTQR